MTIFKKISYFGFLVGMVGFVMAAISEDKSLGINIFMLGFFMVAFGAVLTVLLQPTINGSISSGLKMAAIGFGIAVIGAGISAIYGEEELIPKIALGLGIVVMILGVIVHIGKSNVRN